MAWRAKYAAVYPPSLRYQRVVDVTQASGSVLVDAGDEAPGKAILDRRRERFHGRRLDNKE